MDFTDLIVTFQIEMKVNFISINLHVALLHKLIYGTSDIFWARHKGSIVFMPFNFCHVMVSCEMITKRNKTEWMQHNEIHVCAVTTESKK